MSPIKINEELVVRPSPSKVFKSVAWLLIGGVIMTLGSIFVVIKEDVLLGAAGTIFFGYLTLQGFKMYVLRQHVKNIFITKYGVRTKFLETKQEVFIPWSEIEDLWGQAITTTQFLTTNTNKLYIALKNPLPSGVSKRPDKILVKIVSLLMPRQKLEQLTAVDMPRKFDLTLNDIYEKPLSELGIIIKGNAIYHKERTTGIPAPER